MRKWALTILAAMTLAIPAFAGSDSYSSKDVKQTAAPQPFCDWYANREWNASLWGTYAFTGEEWRDDRYLGVDHAWGGGLDAKYFFMRYFGIGAEGYLLNSRDTVGAALGTLTFRYPISSSRVAPYVFGGAGAVFDSSDRFGGRFFRDDSDDSRAVGQFGGGVEFRLTPHIGLLQDFSWNVVDGPKNNYGMVRTGVTFAF